MKLSDTIRQEIKKAMKEKDKLRLEVLRGLSAAFVNELVAQGRKPDDQIEDDLAIKVLKRALKQRRDSSEQFRAGGRKDLAEKEEKEAEVIKEFLPAELSDEELQKILDELMQDTQDHNFAKLMPAFMQKIAGRADGSRVRKILEDRLSQ